MAFTFNDLPNILLTFGVAVIFGAVIAIVLAAFRDTQTVDTSAYNISVNGLLGVQNISTYFSTSGTLIGVGILITIVIAAFAFGRMRNE